MIQGLFRIIQFGRCRYLHDHVEIALPLFGLWQSTATQAQFATGWGAGWNLHAHRAVQRLALLRHQHRVGPLGERHPGEVAAARRRPGRPGRERGREPLEEGVAPEPVAGPQPLDVRRVAARGEVAGDDEPGQVGERAARIEVALACEARGERGHVAAGAAARRLRRGGSQQGAAVAFGLSTA